MQPRAPQPQPAITAAQAADELIRRYAGQATAGAMASLRLARQTGDGDGVAFWSDVCAAIAKAGY